ncbi:hypothetical protein ACYSUW_13680 [Pseudomonas frederiksbergensis]
MKKYWRELGEAYAAMPRAVYVTFAILCFLPGLLLMPLMWYMAKLAASVVAQAELLSAARSGVILDPSKVNELAALMFSTSPPLLFLVESIVAVIFICSGLFVLVRTAGYFAKRGDKVMAEETPAAAEA